MQSAVMRVRVRYVEVFFSQVGTVYFERPNSLRPLLWHANMGDLVQWEHPQNYGAIGVGAHKTSKISETVQDRTKVTITD